MTIMVSARFFRAAALFVQPFGAELPELQGVHVEPNPRGGVYIVATDTARMLVAWDRAGYADEQATLDLSKDFLGFCSSVPSYPDKTIVVDGNEAVLLDMDLVVMRGAQIRNDVKYPGWRVAPEKFDVWNRSVEMFNPKFIADFGRAADILARSENTPIYFSGGRQAPALVRFAGVDDAFGLLMPLQGECPALELPFAI